MMMSSAGHLAQKCAECKEPIRSGPATLLNCGCFTHPGCWETRRTLCAGSAVTNIMCAKCYATVLEWTVVGDKGKRCATDSAAASAAFKRECL